MNEVLEIVIANTRSYPWAMMVILGHASLALLAVSCSFRFPCVAHMAVLVFRHCLLVRDGWWCGEGCQHVVDVDHQEDAYLHDASHLDDNGVQVLAKYLYQSCLQSSE